MMCPLEMRSIIMSKIIPVTNKALVAYFLKNDIKPQDIFLGRNDTIVFLYDTDKTNDLYVKWENTLPPKPDYINVDTSGLR